MKQIFYIFILLACFVGMAGAQPSIQWQKTYGGSANDECYMIRQTTSGGYVLAGFSNSGDSDITGNHGMEDYWILKLDPTGKKIWQKSFGTAWNDDAYAVEQTTDKGFIVAGYNSTFQYLIIKLDSNGNKVWADTIGSLLSDQRAYSVIQTKDGGYIVAGSATSDTLAGGNYWIVKLSSTGSVQWQKLFGGNGDDTPNSIQQTADNGYIIAGQTWSSDGDVTGNHGNYDYWIVKLNSAGSLIWQKCLGGADDDAAYSIKQTYDGGFIVSGSTVSEDGDVSGKHGNDDYWVVKLSTTGSIQWKRCLGGDGDDEGGEIVQTKDSCYVVTGYAYSNNGDVTGNHGLEDYWVVKLNQAGAILWQKCLGGSSTDWAYSIVQTADGGLITAGYSTSNNGDVSGNKGMEDYWIVKLSTKTGIPDYTVNTLNGLNVYPNPANHKVTVVLNTTDFNPNSILSVYNTKGQLKLQKTLSELRTELDINQLSSGLYIMKVENKNSVITQMFIKE